MNLLIVGAGGREHALAWKCKQSPILTSLHATPGNGGMDDLANCWGITDLHKIVETAVQKKIDLVIIGQENFLVDGLTELLEAEGILVFGPSQKAARLEGSKAFSKDFMKQYGIPSARFEVFEDATKAKNYLKKQTAPYVIKASGLAAGKGVIICEDLARAEQAIDEIMVDKCFGEAGDQVVIEEFLQGEEASWFVFTDGKDFISTPSLQDHKRQLELDRGPNTGGMGCYAPAPIVTDEVAKKVVEEIVKPTLEGMAQAGHPYKGVLYIGLMIDDEEPKVVEYNIRFGDPECQPLMMLLDSDLVELAEACAKEKLKGLNPSWKKEAAACLVLASGGYPGDYEKGHVIQGLEQLKTSERLMVFHAGTKKDQNRFLTAGGRVLGLTCLGHNLKEALESGYQEVQKIHWPGMQYRRDIGLKGLKRIKSSKPETPVVILMGSASDLKIAEKATKIFDQFEIGYRMEVSSAHRTPKRTRSIMAEAELAGVEVFIAIAGMAAHLPGVVAAETQKPVIGVPVDAALGGQDALYSIAQMPPGIPVATVGINRGENAALLAAQILGIKYPEIAAHHAEYRLEMEYKVLESQAEVARR